MRRAAGNTATRSTPVGSDECSPERQNQIIRYVADDFSEKEIAEKLCISLREVEFHKRFIRKKVGVRGDAGIGSVGDPKRSD